MEVDAAVACYLRSDTEHASVMHVNVVTNVYTVHEEAIVTDDGGTIVVKAASNDYVLADAVAVANDDVGAMARLISEALRRSTDNGTLVDIVALANLSTFKDAGMRHDNGARTDAYIFIYIGKRMNLHALAQLC